MSTQGWVFRWQRFDMTETSGIAASASGDAGAMRSEDKVFRAVFGPPFQAARSLNAMNCCKWRFRHGFDERSLSGRFPSWLGPIDGSFPAEFGFETGAAAGSLPEQLRFDSPFLNCVSRLQSALPWVPMGKRPGTERQYGQGNLYFKHAARNAACDFGRRSAR
ncbi:hypothetical protein ACFPT7_16350 [Acidicapsa dinghuensis]|uniref:Uncharacterized protein n=1 Tax=Acidicapsa dinghuensis TaxID=2218256 RepID=A0ABW1EJ56_9BACT|nr:hypothetical protein [Acidicapsa dinghuensis]